MQSKGWRKFWLISICLLGVNLLSAQTEYKTVVAQSGDGIHRLLRKNGLDPEQYYQAFIELNKGRLGKNNGLYKGRSYRLPIPEPSPSDTTQLAPATSSLVTEPDSTQAVSEAETESSAETTTPIAPPKEPNFSTHAIFGEKRAKVTIESDELKGALFYLVSGHGGPDPGAVAKVNKQQIAEDEYAYDVTLRLARKLISKGAKVYIIIQDPNDGIRDDRLLKVDYDEVNYPKKKIPRSPRLRLRQRKETVNALFLGNSGQHSYQRLIVTHVDSRTVGEKIDVFFYHHDKSKKGKKLANRLQETFKKKYARYQPNRKYTGTVAPRSSLYMVKHTLPAMVYIELGNISNKSDQRRILNPDNREALAKWIAEGLEADFKGK